MLSNRLPDIRTGRLPGDGGVKRRYTRKNQIVPVADENDSQTDSDAVSCDKKRKDTIPKALKNAIWLEYCGEVYNHKCLVTWCKNEITPFNFEAGHNIPESKGGATTLDNLRPICKSCNVSMSNRYSIDEFSATFQATAQRPSNKIFSCFGC